MTPTLTLSLAMILALGVGAHWLAMRARLPAILVLLLTGFLAGAGSRHLLEPGHLLYLDPEVLFGGLLRPFVSLAVGVILYEGGLTLQFREIRDVGGVVRNLVTGGALLTWALGAVAARYLLDFDWPLAALLGAILVVTGPTVIGPLLRQIRPQGPTASALKWEGIIIDPIGATLAVLTYEVIHLNQPTASAIEGFLLTAAVGTILGALGAGVLVVALRRHLIPDALQNPASLAVVVTVFAVSNAIHEESGLLAATVMGIVLANQRFVPVKHIIEFKETLRVLLISGLFIVLAATLEPRHLREALDPGVLLFLAALILVVRPLAVAASTAGSRLTTKERLFLAWMAPRGIVAAAVASEFSLRLLTGPNPHPAAERIVAITFIVIVATVTFYGLTSGIVAQRLGLAQADPQGVLMAGAHSWGREIAHALQAEGFRVLLVDTNRAHVAEARLAGLQAVHANVLSEYVPTELDLGGIGRLLAVTPNDEVNTLACERLGELFGSPDTFQLAPRTEGSPRHDPQHYHRHRILFGPDQTFERISSRLAQGDKIKRTKLTKEFPYAEFRRRHESALPLFVIDGERLKVFATENPPEPAPGQILVSLVAPGPGGEEGEEGLG